MGKSDRKHDRHKTLGLMSFISDGKSSVLGIVEDLSATGIKVGQVPLDFDESVQKCKAVIHGPTGDFTHVLNKLPTVDPIHCSIPFRSISVQAVMYCTTLVYSGIGCQGQPS